MSFTDQPTSPQDAPQAPQPPAPAPEAPPAPDAPQSAAQEPDGQDLARQLQALESQVEDLKRRSSSGQLTLAQQDEDLAKRVAELREAHQDWPVKGGTGQPQPWDLEGHGLPQPGKTRDYLPGGQPDEISPVVIGHSQPLLTSGMAGEAVRQLGEVLGQLGYTNSVSEGRNHTFAFDESVASAVAAFKRDYDVKEDPSQFPRQHDPEQYVGPWIWEGLHRLLHREKQAA